MTELKPDSIRNPAPPPVEPTVSKEAIANAERAQSMASIVWSQFRDHRMAVTGLGVIIAFLAIALSAPLISRIVGHDPDDQNAINRYLKPGDTSVLSSSDREDRIARFVGQNPEKAKSLHEALVAQGFIQPLANPEDPLLNELSTKEPTDVLEALAKVPDGGSLVATVKLFTRKHLLGTDELGRDVFIRLIYGARVSIGVGILVALSAALIGLIIGAVSGFYGGWVDSALMRITDSMLALPLLPVLIVVSAISLEKMPFVRSLIPASQESILKLVVILVIFSWMQTALLVRSSVLSLREREFVLAAKTMGAKNWEIIFKHLFPNVIAPLLVSVTIGVGASIQLEATLSFLGLGIQQPTPSWGNMLFNAQDLISEAPFLAIVPGILILLTTISFNYFGDGLRDAIDPKSVRR